MDVNGGRPLANAAGDANPIGRAGPGGRANSGGRASTVGSVLNVTGLLAIVFAALLLLPILIALIYREHSEIPAFLFAAALSSVAGVVLRVAFRPGQLRFRQGLLICGIAWIVLCLFAAVPFVRIAGMSYLDAYFESVSGFTTTGITVITDVESLPRSLLFWRSLIQWLGGLGILTLFLSITIKSNNAYFQLFAAEAHKIESARPTPNIYRTAAVLWLMYAGLTLVELVVLRILGMSTFDALCHSLTTLSTGGFSTYDASIDHFRLAGYTNYRLIEYTITVFMLAGGINFLLHYKMFTGRFREVFRDVEFRSFAGIVCAVVLLILLDRTVGRSVRLFTNAGTAESNVRAALFTVSAIITTTGFGTVDINDPFFPTLSKQLLLVLMLVGGSVGSTAGGIKVLRIVVLWKVFRNQVKRLRLPRRATSGVVIDSRIFPTAEIHRITGLFFGWLFLIVVGGAVTALFTDLDPWQSFSGMFSAVGNIGPAYFSVQQMSELPAIVKVTYVFGMLAGRLEILPILMIFSRKAWDG